MVGIIFAGFIHKEIEIPILIKFDILYPLGSAFFEDCLKVALGFSREHIVWGFKPIKDSSNFYYYRVKKNSDNIHRSCGGMLSCSYSNPQGTVGLSLPGVASSPELPPLVVSSSLPGLDGGVVSRLSSLFIIGAEIGEVSSNDNSPGFCAGGAETSLTLARQSANLASLDAMRTAPSETTIPC